ncbi:MAG: aminotransferase class V-fold PLP-dependent enzyme, partial [Nitrospinae bacterium]|nr:aminotransferase class V-fold PLP-dependent enzyme [Nitrospinota bacterium]
QGVREKEISLVTLIMDALSNEPRATVYGPADPARRGSLISFNIAGSDPAQIATAIDRRGVAVRVGLHCAPEGHKFAGTFPQGAVRVSPGAMTRRKDVETFIRILRRIIKDAK